MSKVSVIIPVYNTEKYLKQCLDSVVNQTLNDIEIICVDDNSTDNSLSVLEEYVKNDNRFILIKNAQNQGTGKSRNKAIDICSGEYIMFLDSDDWFELNACELAYNCIKENDDDIVLFNNYLYYELKNFTKFQNRIKIFDKIENKINIDLKNEFIPNLFKRSAPWASIYKTNFIKENEIYFSETISAEDLPFIVKARILASSVSLLENPLVHYRISMETPPQRCIDRWEEFYDNHKLSYEIIKKNIQNENFYDSFFISLLNQLLYRYDFAVLKCHVPKESVFKKTKELLSNWDSEYDINRVKKYIDIQKYNRFLKSKSYKEYEFHENFLKNIFSVRIIDGRTYLSLFYLKLRIKI